MGTQQFNTKTGRRGIEWSDETRNVIGGCLHECRWEMPDGTTAICYAKQLAEEGLARGGYPHGFQHHYWRPKNLRELVAGSTPSLIFCDSMSDLFGSWVPDEQVIAVLEAMREAPQHVYQSLTKAPKRLLKFTEHMPPNLWVGVSSAPDWFMGKRLTPDQQERYTLSAVAALAEVKARTNNITWMSLEPVSWDMAYLFGDHTLDWVVIGAAMNNGRYFQPDAAHVSRLLDVFDVDPTPVFYKGNIKSTFELYEFGSADRNRWREDFPVRPTGEATGPAPAVARRQRQAKTYGWTLNTFLPEDVPAPVAPVARPSAQLTLFG